MPQATIDRSSLTQRLLDPWHNLEGFDARRFFFCHLEAVETLIWLSEAPAPERHGRRLRRATASFHPPQDRVGGIEMQSWQRIS